MPDTPETTPARVAAVPPAGYVRALVHTMGLPEELGDQLIDARADDVAVRQAVSEAMEGKRSRPVIRVHGGGNDDPAVIRERRADALHVRMAGGEPKPEVRQYLAESVLDTARDALARVGVSTRGLSPDDVFTRAAEHTTSDFPLIVSNAMNKTALASYRAAATPLKTLGRQRGLSNFKPASAIRLGEMGRLEELAESGEFTHTTRAENGETMRLTTYGRAINVSRKLLINDDLGMLGDMTAAFGEAAAQTEADVLVELITGNPDLSDGTPVFDASRGNLAGTGLALGSAGDVAALEGARKAMRGVTGLDGKTLINVTPKYLLVGPELESAAERLLATIYPATVADVNAFGSKLSLLVEPRITDDRWYVFADPARLPAIQYGYLSSAQGVQIQRAEAWDTLGLKFRAWLDFGAGWLDWRGAYLNEGEA
ncbi:phage major capsid protein [Wenxinia marina]|uniref:Mu-like prophage major head subunit gpT n=1 Tax=Wenxinia marina DSM 24838 TaxID=1123501 RepID=A0A0D0NQL9_9RHOB|nr:Mu-like prophage major head subunit gpT family protein [Wenxinia marina]KIQ70560.1 Mu-like prophage major head subunit gpT [Wenxinia marina DSM 24838]